jgi:uncharacterized membrane protein
MLKAVGVSSDADLANELDARWWREEVGLPADFIRDVGAMIQPGDSAIFVLLPKKDHLQVVRQLSNYGGTLLHAALDASQDVKVSNALGIPDLAKASA